MEEHADAVMLEAAEAVTAALELLDAEVQAFGRSVAGAGVVAGEDLGSPAPEGLAERDAGQPVGIHVGGPASQVLGAVDVRHVDEHVLFEVDEAGGVDRRVLTGRFDQRVSSAQAGAPGRSVGVID